MQARTLQTWIARRIGVRRRLERVCTSYLLFLRVCPTFYTWSFSPGCAAPDANHDSRTPYCNAHPAF